jgi:peptidoglycan/xylan/chitin deacetylase (PgdA/CDA1 family)
VFQPSETAFLDWTRANPPSPGDIVLLHDSAPVLRGGLPALIADARQRGLGFATVSELLSSDATERP